MIGTVAANRWRADFTAAERRLFLRLNRPEKIQDYPETLRINFRGTYRSPRFVIRHGEAQCFEGALLAAAALWYHGERPLLLDLRADPVDDDHVVALFHRPSGWGAISKTNHAVLRYREPVYKTTHELALSYFHEYFDDRGRKNLRSFSRPFNLAANRWQGWVVAEHDLDDMADTLDCSPHVKMLTPAARRGLRRPDDVEIKAGKLVVWQRNRR